MTRKIIIEMDVSPDFNAHEFFEKFCDDQTDNYRPNSGSTPA